MCTHISGVCRRGKDGETPLPTNEKRKGKKGEKELEMEKRKKRRVVRSESATGPM